MIDEMAMIARPFLWSWEGEPDPVISKSKLEEEGAVKFRTKKGTVIVVAQNHIFQDKLSHRKCPYPIFLLDELAKMGEIGRHDIDNVLELKRRFCASVNSVLKS